MAVINMLPQSGGGNVLPNDVITSGVLNSKATPYIVDGVMSQNSGYYRLQTNGNNTTIVGFPQSVDLTRKSRIVLMISQARSWQRSNTFVSVLGVGRNQPWKNPAIEARFSFFDASAAISASEGTIYNDLTITLDVSSLAGFYFVAITLSGTGNYSGYYNITDLYIE